MFKKLTDKFQFYQEKKQIEDLKEQIEQMKREVYIADICQARKASGDSYISWTAVRNTNAKGNDKEQALVIESQKMIDGVEKNMLVNLLDGKEYPEIWPDVSPVSTGMLGALKIQLYDWRYCPPALQLLILNQYLNIKENLQKEQMQSQGKKLQLEKPVQ